MIERERNVILVGKKGEKKGEGGNVEERTNSSTAYYTYKQASKYTAE